jgi:mono/diheme cytochrome c family protein
MITQIKKLLYYPCLALLLMDVLTFGYLLRPLELQADYKLRNSNNITQSSLAIIDTDTFKPLKGLKKLRKKVVINYNNLSTKLITFKANFKKVERVIFYIDGQIVRADTTQPYTLTEQGIAWHPKKDSYIIKAVASYKNAQNSAEGNKKSRHVRQSVTIKLSLLNRPSAPPICSSSNPICYTTGGETIDSNETTGTPAPSSGTPVPPNGTTPTPTSSNGNGEGGGGTTNNPPSATTTPTPIPTTPPVSLGRGVFDCKTVEAPPYTGIIAHAPTPTPGNVTLSSKFTLYCASCHGTLGEGSGRYPMLPGNLSEDAFVSVVRNGRLGNGMPAFSTTTNLDDATIRADYRSLKLLRNNGQTSGSNNGTTGKIWSDTEVEQVYQRGMTAWWTPDEYGSACASCHSPDAIDLALIAYPDDAIQRRGNLHLSPDDINAVRDLIHAQRQRFNITAPCDREWRPFQPGGEPLPGNTPDERDINFYQYLKDIGLRIAGDPITDVATAKAAWRQFAELDLRRTKIGIHLPHWTRDPFNGESHKTFDDWMGALDTTNDINKLKSVALTYIANPTDQNYFNYETEALGYLGNAYGGLYKDWFNNVSKAKRRAVLLGSHYFRRELLGLPGWYDQPRSPFPEFNMSYSPFAIMGGATQEFSCSPNGGSFGGGTCPQLMSTIMKMEQPKFGGPTEAEMNKRLASFTHTWWTVANLFDQPMLRSEDNAIDGGMFYWSGRFPESAIHLPFFFAHVVAAQWLYQNDYNGHPIFPVVASPFSTNVPVLLNGDYVNDRMLNGLPGIVNSEDEPTYEISIHFRVNLIRTILLIQKDELDRGKPVANAQQIRNFYTDGVPAISWLIGNLARDWGNAGYEDRHPSLKGKRALYTTELEKLMLEVLDKINKAPKVSS